MRKLNINFPKAVARFELAMKEKFLSKTVFYKRAFGGKGAEFESYKNYSFGDDASLIDWKATMRAGGEPLIRQYLEERDLKIFFIVDVGENMVLGSGEKLKNETAAEIAASLAHLIIISGDSIGYLLYSDKIVRKKN